MCEIKLICIRWTVETRQLFATNKRFPIALQVHGLDQGSGKLGESYYSLEPGGCILSKAPIKKYASAYTVRLQLHTYVQKDKKVGKASSFLETLCRLSREKGN